MKSHRVRVGKNMGRVLIIEDDRDTRETVADILRWEGHEVRTATDGVDAIRELLATNSLPTVVLLDSIMPRLDGRHLLDWLAQNPRFEGLPVIVTSGETSVFEHRRATAVLRKPFEIEALLSLLRQFS